MGTGRSKQRWVALAARYLSVIFILPSTLLLGYGLGCWMDETLGTTPWLLMLFLILGAVAGFLYVFRLLGTEK